MAGQKALAQRGRGGPGAPRTGLAQRRHLITIGRVCANARLLRWARRDALGMPSGYLALWKEGQPAQHKLSFQHKLNCPGSYSVR